MCKCSHFIFKRRCFICIIAKFQKSNKGPNFYCHLFKNSNEAT